MITKAITFIDLINLGKLHLNFRKYLYSYLHITNIYFSEIRLSAKDFFNRNQRPMCMSLYLYWNVNSRITGCYGVFLIVIAVEFILNVTTGCIWNTAHHTTFISISENDVKFLVVNLKSRLFSSYIIFNNTCKSFKLLIYRIILNWLIILVCFNTLKLLNIANFWFTINICLYSGI